MFLRNICAFSEIPAKNKHYIVELNAAHFKFTIIYWNGNKLKHWNELRHKLFRYKEYNNMNILKNIMKCFFYLLRFISSLSISLPGQRRVPHLV